MARLSVAATVAVVAAATGLCACGGTTTTDTVTAAAQVQTVTQTSTATQTQTETHTVAVTRRVPVRVTRTLTVTTTEAASTAAAPQGANAPAPHASGVQALTIGRVRAAEDGSTAMAQICLDEANGTTPTSADYAAAAKGENDLTDALQQDPDTRYTVPAYQGGGTVEITMRELAAQIANWSGPCAFSSDMQTALDGLPSG